MHLHNWNGSTSTQRGELPILVCRCSGRGPQFHRMLDTEPHAAAYCRTSGFRVVPAAGVLSYSRPAMKSIESAAMRGLVPDAILARKERSGFPVPAKEWLDELAPGVETNIVEIVRLPFFEPGRVISKIARENRELD